MAEPKDIALRFTKPFTRHPLPVSPRGTPLPAEVYADPGRHEFYFRGRMPDSVARYIRDDLVQSYANKPLPMSSLEAEIAAATGQPSTRHTPLDTTSITAAADKARDVFAEISPIAKLAIDHMEQVLLAGLWANDGTP